MITEQDITGTWILVARGNDDPEDARVSIERYGRDPRGMVIISPDGWMNASLCHGERPPLSSENVLLSRPSLRPIQEIGARAPTKTLGPAFLVASRYLEYLQSLRSETG